MKKLTANQKEFVKGVIFLILLALTVACAAHKPVINQQEVMLAWFEDTLTDKKTIEQGGNFQL